MNDLVFNKKSIIKKLSSFVFPLFPFLVLALQRKKKCLSTPHKILWTKKI